MLALIAFCAVMLSWLWYFTSFEKLDTHYDLREWLDTQIKGKDAKPNERK